MNKPEHGCLLLRGYPGHEEHNIIIGVDMDGWIAPGPLSLRGERIRGRENEVVDWNEGTSEPRHSPYRVRKRASRDDNPMTDPQIYLYSIYPAIPKVGSGR